MKNYVPYVPGQLLWCLVSCADCTEGRYKADKPYSPSDHSAAQAAINFSLVIHHTEPGWPQPPALHFLTQQPAHTCTLVTSSSTLLCVGIQGSGMEVWYIRWMKTTHPGEQGLLNLISIPLMFFTCCIKRKNNVSCDVELSRARPRQSMGERSVVLDWRIHGEQCGSVCFSSIRQQACSVKNSLAGLRPFKVFIPQSATRVSWSRLFPHIKE